MKKVLLLTVLTVLAIANASAQKVKFGVKAGLNFASIYGDNTTNVESVTSFNFGLVSEIPITKKFSFQPEIMYSGQGFSIKDNPGNDPASLNYLNFPLMAKYYIVKGLSIEAGPQVGYLLSFKNATTYGKDDFKKVDFGANLGLGYKLENGINFNARYNFGISNINDSNGISDKFRNGVFQVSIGYFFF